MTVKAGFAMHKKLIPTLIVHYKTVYANYHVCYVFDFCISISDLLFDVFPIPG